MTDAVLFKQEGQMTDECVDAGHVALALIRVAAPGEEFAHRGFDVFEAKYSTQLEVLP